MKAPPPFPSRASGLRKASSLTLAPARSHHSRPARARSSCGTSRPSRLLTRAPARSPGSSRIIPPSIIRARRSSSKTQATTQSPNSPTATALPGRRFRMAGVQPGSHQSRLSSGSIQPTELAFQRADRRVARNLRRAALAGGRPDSRHRRRPAPSLYGIRPRLRPGQLHAIPAPRRHWSGRRRHRCRVDPRGSHRCGPTRIRNLRVPRGVVARSGRVARGNSIGRRQDSPDVAPCASLCRCTRARLRPPQGNAAISSALTRSGAPASAGEASRRPTRNPQHGRFASSCHRLKAGLIGGPELFAIRTEGATACPLFSVRIVNNSARLVHIRNQFHNENLEDRTVTNQADNPARILWRSSGRPVPPSLMNP